MVTSRGQQLSLRGCRHEQGRDVHIPLKWCRPCQRGTGTIQSTGEDAGASSLPPLCEPILKKKRLRTRTMQLSFYFARSCSTATTASTITYTISTAANQQTLYASPPNGWQRYGTETELVWIRSNRISSTLPPQHWRRLAKVQPDHVHVRRHGLHLQLPVVLRHLPVLHWYVPAFHNRNCAGRAGV